MEDGRLTDGHGRTVDFRNSVIIMTSNLGTRIDTRAQFGFSQTRTQTEAERTQQHKNVERALQGFFRPEFLNRIDEIIIFEPLTEAELRHIVDIMLAEVEDRLAPSDRSRWSSPTRPRTSSCAKATTASIGARPLRRTIERRVENALAKRILGGDFAEGDHAVIDSRDGEFVFRKGPDRRGAGARRGDRELSATFS